MKSNNSFLPNITFLRFIAAIWIVFYHFGLKITSVKSNEFFFKLLNNGFQAVTFFYVLSGFIMAYLYYQIFFKDTTFKFTFWKARFARIYPAYFFALMLSLLVYFSWGDKVELNKFLLEFFCIQTWGINSIPSYYNYPDWSISVEFFFYLIFPFVLVWVASKKSSFIGIFVFVTWIVTQLIYSLLSSEGQRNLENFPILHVASFLLGIFGGILFYRFNQKILLINKIKFSLVLAIVFLLIFGSQLLFHLKSNVGLYAPFYLILIIFLVSDRSKISYFFSNSIATYLGEISYSIYIFQFPVYIFACSVASFLKLNTDSIFFLSLFTLILIIVSILTFHFIEKPFRYLISKKK